MAQELLFSRTPGRHWAALREDGALVELRVEDDAARLAVGRVIKARVSRVLPGIQAAFLDVGDDRDAFLHASDLLLPGEEPGLEAPEPEAAPPSEEDDDEDDEAASVPRLRARRRNAVGRIPIEQRLREGRSILVQVAREEIGSKGARVTSFISLPGRFLVFMPYWSYLGVSRRISDPEERTRLREILERLPRASGGFIVRTAGEGKPEGAFEADARGLVGLWQEMATRAERAATPTAVHSDFELPLRILRDVRPEDVERVVFDDPATFEQARRTLTPLEPALAARLSLHAGAAPLFVAEGLDREIDRALRPRVWLRSGGTIVIEQTEALVSIDVNTGKYVGSRRPEDTIVRTNLEAAEEIARQLRLRDLGGIIVVDFIDMDRAESRKRVLAAFEAALSRDRARTKVVGLSELGLVQLTRKRTRAGVEAMLTRPCPICQGHGRVRSPDTLAAEALGEVRRLAVALDSGGPLTLRVHPDIARALRLALQDPGTALDASLAARVIVEDDPTARPDQFDVRAG